MSIPEAFIRAHILVLTPKEGSKLPTSSFMELKKYMLPEEEEALVSFFPYHDTKSNLHYLAIYGSIDIAEAKYSALVSSVDHTTGTIEVERTSSAETVDFALKAASHYIRDPIENDFAGLAWIGIFYEREEITRFSLSLEEKRMRLDRDAYEIKLREIELDQPRQDIAYRGLLFEGKVLLTMFTRVPFR